MRIEKKIWPDAFQNILDSVKTFEVRLADWECKVGDLLVLREWDPKTKQYTGRAMEKTAAYIAKTKDMEYWTQDEVDKYGFQIIGLK